MRQHWLNPTTSLLAVTWIALLCKETSVYNFCTQKSSKFRGLQLSHGLILASLTYTQTRPCVHTHTRAPLSAHSLSKPQPALVLQCSLKHIHEQLSAASGTKGGPHLKYKASGENRQNVGLYTSPPSIGHPSTCLHPCSASPPPSLRLAPTVPDEEQVN